LYESLARMLAALATKGAALHMLLSQVGLLSYKRLTLGTLAHGRLDKTPI